MTQIIAMAMQKGGMAKTTSAVNLAHGLALAGHPTLLVDLDSQGSCSRFLGVQSERGLADVMAGTLAAGQVIIEARPNLNLITGDYRLTGILGSKDISEVYELREKMDPILANYEYIVLDTPPAWGFGLISALMASDYTITPLTLQIASINAFRDFMTNVSRLRRIAEIDVRYLLPVIVDRRLAQTKEITADILPGLGLAILPDIPISARIQESNGFGETIFEYDPNGRGAMAYKNVIEVLTNGT